jgi:hypothetical protein
MQMVGAVQTQPASQESPRYEAPLMRDFLDDQLVRLNKRFGFTSQPLAIPELRGNQLESSGSALWLGHAACDFVVEVGCL